MSKAILIEISGWFGAIAILAGYLAISLNILDSQNLIYQTLNLTGAAGITVSSLHKKDIPAGALNAIWCIIALVAMIRIIFKI
jgi:hypothetical protein